MTRWSAQLPEGPTGRSLALAIAVLAVVLVYFAVVSPVMAFYQDRADDLERRAGMAQRYAALAHDLPALRAADKRWRDKVGGELLLDGDSDAVASASLQAAMKSLVEDAGARLLSAEVLPATAEGNFRRVGLRVVISGDLKLVTAVLRAGWKPQSPCCRSAISTFIAAPPLRPGHPRPPATRTPATATRRTTAASRPATALPSRSMSMASARLE